MNLPIHSRWLLPYISVGLFIIFASAVGLGPFSGYHSPPLYGDFEAQRHWLEITTSLHPHRWYFYDLQWWGLDYPPLTAFHSFALGKLGSFFNPEWFALDSSRGLESDGLKAYMRFTVLLSELMFYVPFVFSYAQGRAVAQGIPAAQWYDDLTQFLLLPSVLIIDNGHFQYNTVMLGFFIGSLVALQRERFVVASVLFVLALFFKQMALFWSPVVFFYILGKCTFDLQGFKRLVSVGSTVIGTSVLLLLPWITSGQQLLQVVHRVFPFGRGLWEDKVANFWCATNTLVKYRELYDSDDLRRYALYATLAAIAPSCLAAYLCRSRVKLTIAFSCCAWSFYLFGFQVHEKSVLVPLVPTCLLMFEGRQEWTAMVQWLQNVSYYSMFPLLHREGLELQFFVLLVLFNSRPQFPRHWLNQLVVGGSYAAIAVVSLCELLDLVPMAAKYADLYVVGNLTISFGCFVYGSLWLHKQLYSAPSTTA